MILGVLASGRRGNGDRLLAEILAGARGAGAADTRVHRLAALTFRGCIGCGACRAGADGCVERDDLTPVLADTAAARAMVLVAPNYYGYASGLFKSYLDRWYGFRDADRTLRVPAGRKALLVLTQGNPDPDAYPWTRDSLLRTLSGYGLEPSAWVAAGLEGPTDADARPDLLAEARRVGAEFV